MNKTCGHVSDPIFALPAVVILLESYRLQRVIVISASDPEHLSFRLLMVSSSMVRITSCATDSIMP